MSDQPPATSSAATAPKSDKQKNKPKGGREQVSNGSKFMFRKGTHVPAINVQMNKNPTGAHRFLSNATNLGPFIDAVTNVICGKTQLVQQDNWSFDNVRNFIFKLTHLAIAVKLANSSEYIDVGSSPILSLLRNIPIDIPDCIRGFVNGFGSFTLDQTRFRVDNILIRIFTHFFRAVGDGIPGFNADVDFIFPKSAYNRNILQRLFDSQFEQSFFTDFLIQLNVNGQPINVGRVKLPQIDGPVNGNYVAYLVAAGYAIPPVITGRLGLLAAMNDGGLAQIQDADLPLFTASGIHVVNHNRDVIDQGFNAFISEVYQRSTVLSTVFNMSKMTTLNGDGSPGQLLSNQNGRISCPFSLSADDLSYGFMIGANCIYIDYDDTQNNIQFDTFTSVQFVNQFVSEDKAQGR